MIETISWSSNSDFNHNNNNIFNYFQLLGIKLWMNPKHNHIGPMIPMPKQKLINYW